MIMLAEVVLDGRVIYTNPDMGEPMTDEATPDTGTGSTSDDAVGPGHPNYRAPLPADPSDPPVEVNKTSSAGDLLAEVDKWKTQSRKHEDRAKANANAAKELEQLKAASMSDLEKAVDIARKEGRAEALQLAGTKLVDAEVKAAAAGRGVDVDALLEGLDRTRFLTDDGDADSEAIQAWVDRIAPAREEGFPDLGQGARSGDEALGLGGDPLYQSLKRMTGAR